MGSQTMRNFSYEPQSWLKAGRRCLAAGTVVLSGMIATVPTMLLAEPNSSAKPLEIAGFSLDEAACDIIEKIVDRGFADLDDKQWEQVERAGCGFTSGFRNENTVPKNADDPRMVIEMGYCTNDLVRKAEKDWASDKQARWDIARIAGNLKEEELKCITAINLRGGFLPYSWASHIKISFRDYPNRTSEQCDPTRFKDDDSKSVGYSESAPATADENDVEKKDTSLYGGSRSSDGKSEGPARAAGTPNCPTGPVDSTYNTQPYNTVVHRVDWWIHWQNQDQWRLLARARVVRDFFERYQTDLYPKPAEGKKLFKLRACHAVAGRAKTQLVYQGPAPITEVFGGERAKKVKKCNCEADYKDQYLVFTVSQQPDASVTLWKGPAYERAWESQRNRYISEQLDREIMDTHLSADPFGPNYGRYDAKPDNAKIINRSKARAPSSVRPYIGGEACREVLKFNKFQKNYYKDGNPKKGPLLPNL